MGYDRAQRSRGFPIPSSATVVTICAENSNRKGLTVFNDSTAALYLKKGSAATTTDYFVKILAGGYFEFQQSPIYEGIVTGIWASANGYAYCSEDT